MHEKELAKIISYDHMIWKAGVQVKVMKRLRVNVNCPKFLQPMCQKFSAAFYRLIEKFIT